MLMKGYFTFPRPSTLLEPHHLGWRLGVVLPLCREAVSVFYNPSGHGNMFFCVAVADYLGFFCWRFIYEGESQSNAFLFNKGIIADTSTCTIYQNEASPLWITSLLINIVPVSLNSNVPPSNNYPCDVEFCWLSFEPLHHCSFHFLVTGIMFIISSALWKRV